MSGFTLKGAADQSAAEDDGTVVNVKDASGDLYDPPVTVRVAGSYSTKAKKADKDFNAKLAKIGRRGGDVEEALANRSQAILAECIIKWDGLVSEDGKSIPLSVSNALTVFDAAPWIFSQVYAANQAHELFFEKS